ncbi:MAG: CvpA family protein [Acidimicrobiia bacterium]|nr:CvpA family protein [Acidimicrobiia bacterium]
MLDVILGAALAAAVVHGWLRGFIRSAIGLAVVVLGAFLAFRLSAAAGSVVAGIAGTSPETSRVFGGVVVFGACAVGGAVVSAGMRRVIGAMPGLPTLDRAAGAVAAGLAGVLVVTLVMSAVRVLPLGAVGRAVEASTLASKLTDPDGLAQRTLALVGGDGALAVALRLDDAFGQSTLGDPGGATIVLDVPAGTEAFARPDQADALFQEVNRARSAAGVSPLARAANLDAVAQGHANEMYAGGWMAHASPDGTRLVGRLAAASIPATAVAELIGLGPTPSSIVDEWVGAPGSANRLGRPNVTRMGVAVGDGPLGLLAVVVMTG